LGRCGSRGDFGTEGGAEVGRSGRATAVDSGSADGAVSCGAAAPADLAFCVRGGAFPPNRNAVFVFRIGVGRCGGWGRWWGRGRDRRRSVSGDSGCLTNAGGYCVWKKNRGRTRRQNRARRCGRQGPGTAAISVDRLPRFREARAVVPGGDLARALAHGNEREAGGKAEAAGGVRAALSRVKT
jgi:hypothetical protein